MNLNVNNNKLQPKLNESKLKLKLYKSPDNYSLLNFTLQEN